MDKRNQLYGYLYVCLAALCWGVIGPMAKLAFQAGVPPMEVAFWRALLGALFYAVHCVVFRQARMAPKAMLVMALFGLVGVSLFFSSYLIAVQEGGAALAAMLLYTAPAWVAVLARIFLKESLTQLKLAGLAVSMGGALLICLGGASGDSGGGVLSGLNWKALVFGLLSGFSYATHYIFAKRYLGNYSGATIYMYCLPIGALGLTPWIGIPHYSALVWGVLFCIAIGSTYVAYQFYCAGLKRLDATRVAVTANLEPLVAAVTAYLWWDELFSPLGFLGAGLILAGVAIMIWEGRRKVVEISA